MKLLGFTRVSQSKIFQDIDDSGNEPVKEKNKQRVIKSSTTKGS